ncbi:MAG: hypothetical protein Q8L09_00595 [Candidatus Moranbacteria bacterium]|nr:hypothetical protein [Candidatus Moranbacteria bacterium]
MKLPTFVILFALSGARLATAQPSGLTLVAKCGFPDADQGVDVIRPGTPFIYFFEDSGEIFVVNSIANRSEKLTDPVAGLAGELVPIAARGRIGGTVEWSQPDLTGASSSQENVIGLWGTPGTPFTTSGTSSYTPAAYPTCMIFGD